MGRVRHVYFDQSSQSGKRIIVATEDAALAVINTRTGGISEHTLHVHTTHYTSASHYTHTTLCAHTLR